jgi:hypothetical protein
VRAAVLLVLSIPLVLAACESTQDKSARLAREGKGAVNEKGLVVKQQSRDVKVLGTDVITDANGTAAVVTLRSSAGKPLVQVPVSIDVTGTRGKTVFRNNQPGAEPTLGHVPVITSRQKFVWVNDQVSPTAKAHSVRARVGVAREVDAKHVPKIVLTGVHLTNDEVSGIEATGFVANRSKIDQLKLVVFAVARKGSKVVAAGRAQIARLKSGKRARFHVFFIGNPSGGRLVLAAPPSTLARG